MAFDYTNLYPDSAPNGCLTKSWNYTTLDSIATVSASGYFNAVATRVGIGDNIYVASVDAFDSRTRTTLVGSVVLLVSTIVAGVVTTSASIGGATIGVDVQAFDPQLSSLIRQVSKSANYTTILTDGGKHILHPTADNNARDFTIDSNANVAYPIGTAITFVNQINTITIKITTDTMTLASTGTTGNRTLAAKSIATALKIASQDWIISGSGLT